MDAEVAGSAITGVCGVIVAIVGVWGAIRMERVKKVAERAEGAAITAVEQTRSTGNGHAARVESGIGEVLARLDRVDTRVERIEGAVLGHLQSHAASDVAHRDLPRREVA